MPTAYIVEDDFELEPDVEAWSLMKQVTLLPMGASLPPSRI
jgi:hypothetical protein